MLGVDLVGVDRLARALARSPRLSTRTFSAAELATAETRGRGRAEFLAGRFAVKEAVLKAYGVGVAGGVMLADVEVVPAADGAPTVRLRGEAARLAERRGLTPSHVSISHEAGFAVAVALLTPSSS